MAVLNDLEISYLKGLGLVSSDVRIKLIRVSLTGELNATQYYVINKAAPYTNPITWSSTLGSTLNLDTTGVTHVADDLTGRGYLLSESISSGLTTANYSGTGLKFEYFDARTAKDAAPIRVDAKPTCTIVNNVMSNWSFPKEYDKGSYFALPESTKGINSYSSSGNSAYDAEALNNIRSKNTNTVEGSIAYYLDLIGELDNLDTTVGWVASQSSNLTVRRYANRRRVWFGGNRPSDVFVVYLKGSGRDILFQSRRAPDDKIYYSVNYVNIESNPITHLTSDQTAELMFPLNNIGGLIDNIEGTYVESKSLGFDYTGDGSIEVFDAQFDVNKAWGHISVDFVKSYWATGLGVYDGLSDEVVSENVKTWNLAAPTGIYYVVSNESCGGRSLTETEFYGKYVSIRRKACKDNNFMTLSYNSDYTMQQVEDMLGKLTSRNVWCSDDVATSSDAVSYVSGTVTLTNSDDGRILATDQSGSISYFSKDEAGIQSLFSKYATYLINDASSIIDKVSGQDQDGETIAAHNSALKETTTSQYSLSKSSVVTSFARSYVDLLNDGSSKQAQLAFLCSQVTTYKGVPQMINSLLKEFNFDTLAAKLLKAGKLT